MVTTNKVNFQNNIW